MGLHLCGVPHPSSCPGDACEAIPARIGLIISHQHPDSGGGCSCFPLNIRSLWEQAGWGLNLFFSRYWKPALFIKIYIFPVNSTLVLSAQDIKCHYWTPGVFEFRAKSHWKCSVSLVAWLDFCRWLFPFGSRLSFPIISQLFPFYHSLKGLRGSTDAFWGSIYWAVAASCGQL